MTVLTIIRNVLSQFARLELPPAVLDQIINATISSVEESPGGAFADIESVSEAIFASDCPDVSIIRTLANQDEVADAILHLRNGKIEYLEIALYDPSAGWEQLGSVVLK